MKIKEKIAVFVVLVFVFSASINSSFVLAIESTKKVDNLGDWTLNSGNLTQDDSGLVFSGNGTGMLLESFYQETFSSVNGFSATVDLDAIGSLSNTNFGLSLTSAASSASNGLKIIISPYADNPNISACQIHPYYNNGDGPIYSAATNNYLEINKPSGAFNISLSREDGGVWHLFANGVDTGTDLSAIKTVLDAGNLYFGIYAWSQNQNNYSIKLKQLFGCASAKTSEFSESNLIKSTKGNVAANQNAQGTEDGFELNGSLTSVGCNFKYGFNTAFTVLNGFNTTINATMDGVNGTNGAPNFNFGLSSTGSGINGDRLDTWDYYGSAVTGARGLDIRFKNFGSYFSTNILVLGANGELNYPADFLNGENIAVPADGNINISFITTNNGGASHWSILANGRVVISNNTAVNAELDALSSMGAYPIYSAGYDDIGSLGTAKAKLFIQNINGKMYNTTLDTADTTNKITGTRPVLDSDFVYSGINPTAKYSITNDGIKVSAMNGPGGFQSMLTYGTKLNTSNLGVTLKLNTVFASTNQNPHHIDILIGNRKDANFTEQKCVYVRLTTKGNAPQDGLTSQVVLNTTGLIGGVKDLGTSMNIPVSSDGLVVLKLIKINGVYRIYINGLKFSTTALNAEILDLLDTQLGGKGYLEVLSAWDGVTNQSKPTIYTLKAVNGLQFIDGTPVDTTDTKNAITGERVVTDSNFVYSGFNPKAQYLITNDGVKVTATTGTYGFLSMLTYGTQLDTSNLGVTLKLEKVFASTSQNPHQIGFILGNKKNANFIEQKCIYIRLTTKGNTPKDGLTAQVIINTTGVVKGIKDFGKSLDIPVSSDGLVVLKLIKVDGIYRIYINGTRFPTTGFDAEILDLLDTRLAGKGYIEIISSWDGITNQTTPTVFYLKTVNGLNLVKTGNPDTNDNIGLYLMLILLSSGTIILLKNMEVLLNGYKQYYKSFQ